jgi:sRNA-binding carbon storage regulator CsrA
MAVGDRIFVGDDIIITFLERRSNGVISIGIKAPREVPVDREKVRISKLLNPEGKTSNGSHRPADENEYRSEQNPGDRGAPPMV